MKVLTNIFKNIGVMILAIAILVIGQVIENALYDLFSNVYLRLTVPCIVRIIVTVLIAWLVSSKLLGIPADELGVKIKKFDIRLLLLSIALPLSVLAFYTFILPSDPYVAKEGVLGKYIVDAVFSAGLTAGITEEVVFRGIIFRYMKKTFGVKPAVIVPAVLFALVHITNMQTFNFIDVTLLILAGSSVSVMFTFMALHSGSIYPGAIAHALWNAFIIGGVFGVGDIVNGVSNYSCIIIPIASKSNLLTGGNFGIEAALPGSIGYITVAVIVFLMMRKKAVNE